MWEKFFFRAPDNSHHPSPLPSLEENNDPSPYDVNNIISRYVLCSSLGGIEEPLNFDRYHCKVNKLSK